MPPNQPAQGGLTDADFTGMLDEAEWMKFKTGQFRIGFIDLEGIAVFSAGAPVGFRIIRETLLVDLLLHLSRFLDDAGTGQKTNRSLERAIATLRERKLPEWTLVRVGVELKYLAETFTKSNLETIRNKLIAHSDLATARLADWPNAPVTEIAVLCERVYALVARITELAIGNCPSELTVAFGEMTPIRNYVRSGCEELGIKIQGDPAPN